MVLGIELAAIGGLLPYSKDSVLFVFYLSLIFWAIGAAGSIFIVILYQILAKLYGWKRSRLHVRRLLISLMILSLLCVQGILFWITLNRPVYLNSFRVIAGIISIFLLSCFVAFFLGRILIRIFSGKGNRPGPSFMAENVDFYPRLFCYSGFWTFFNFSLCGEYFH